MKNSLRKKYILAGTFLVIGFLALLLLTSRLLKEGLVENWNRTRMENIAAQVINELETYDWDISRADIDNLAFENNVSIALTDEDLKILTTTRVGEATRGTLGGKTQTLLTQKKQELDENGRSFFSNFDDNNRAAFTQMDRVEGHGYVIIRKSITGLNSSMRVMEICYIIAALLVLLIGIPVIVYLTGKMVSPIVKINQATKQIARLNFDERVPVSTNDELGALAESVNTMSDQLKEAMGNLQKDVELRETLVRNMAHELKTPTAVIMGYAENMSYIAAQHPEKLEKYCTVISNECERMSTMINQMLEVSRKGRGKDTLHISEFSAEDLLAAVHKCYDDECRDRRGVYEEENEIQGTIRGDFLSLQQALYNLIKNAVRHGKKDGRIHVRAWEEQQYACFSVFNEGDPIPAEEQEKIWNVFYKVNPARTREEKSFGIGLSIVKQAAVSHDGGVAVDNVEGGVEFKIFVKKQI